MADPRANLSSCIGFWCVCNKLPQNEQLKNIHIFISQFPWVREQLSWVLCLGSHEATIKVLATAQPSLGSLWANGKVHNVCIMHLLTLQYHVIILVGHLAALTTLFYPSEQNPMQVLGSRPSFFGASISLHYASYLVFPAVILSKLYSTTYIT